MLRFHVAKEIRLFGKRLFTLLTILPEMHIDVSPQVRHEFNVFDSFQAHRTLFADLICRPRMLEQVVSHQYPLRGVTFTTYVAGEFSE